MVYAVISEGLAAFLKSLLHINLRKDSKYCIKKMKKFLVSNKKFCHTFERHSQLLFFSDDLCRDWCDLCKISCGGFIYS